MIADPRSVAAPGTLPSAQQALDAAHDGPRRLGFPIAQLAEWVAIVYLVALVLAAILAEHIPGLAAPNAPFGEFSQPPTLSVNGLLGTDPLGRSIFVRVIYGARASLTVACVATLISLTLGLLLGMLAGFYRGFIERVVDLYASTVASLPPILLILGLVAATGASLLTITVALGILGIGTYARITKGGVIAQSEREYILAARALGANDARVLALELFPNLLPTLTAVVPPLMAALIVTEGSLSFLGYGIPPPTPSWGGMIAGSTDLLSRFPLLVFGPILAILLTVFSLNAVGDRLARRISLRDSQL